MLFVTNTKRPKDTSTELEGEMRSNSRKWTPMNSIHRLPTTRRLNTLDANGGGRR